MNNKEKDIENNRPEFPKRAVITGGMPYGNKELHFGHIGGVFVHADTFARFMRDRIGRENVIFVSGTDCYGSPIVEHYRQLLEKNEFSGTIKEFVEMNHKKQKDVLDAYNIDINLFAASGLGRYAEIHKEVSDEFINALYENGHLVKATTAQFYDRKNEVFLNGRQVVGRCPIAGCSSEKAYADECDLGHQYMPVDLINPKSTLSGEKPEMKDVTNWYFKLNDFHELLNEWVSTLENKPNIRRFYVKSIKEFMEPPVIYIKNDQIDILNGIRSKLPEHNFSFDDTKKPIVLKFDKLEKREEACKILTEYGIRYRTGKTLVPFRLTGNVEWGVLSPDLEDLYGLTIWVWPESLWAPVSFTRAYLENIGKDKDDWKNWWLSKEAKAYQFIGEDNIYFYGPVEMAILMGLQGKNPASNPDEGDYQIPELIANKHIMFLDKKASSSGKVKPPMAGDLLDYYTDEQLRAHFLGLGLGIKSVGFCPKPLNPKAGEKDADPVLKEGNLLSNVLNRVARSCFYSVQKYFDGKIPVGDIDDEIINESNNVILEYEKKMYNYEFHIVMNLLDTYIRNMNKYWSKHMREAENNDNNQLRKKTLVNIFHMLRTAIVLTHPVAPKGTEMILDYLNLDSSFWNWSRIFDKIYDFIENPEEHKLKFLEPRVDFFVKHESQISKFLNEKSKG